MPTIASLLVKITADAKDVQDALAKISQSAKSVDGDLKKIGNTPLGQAGQKSLDSYNASLLQITTSQQRMAERAADAARGLDTIGGPAKLTRQELDQVNKTLQQGVDAFRALGQEAPQDLQRVATAVAAHQKGLEGSTTQTSLFAKAQGLLGGQLALVAGPTALGFAIKQTLDYADTLTKMSDRTGIGTDALQRLEAIAKPSGNTLEELASGINKFQKGLAEGDSATIDGLRRIGLSLAGIRDLKPDEQFIAIAQAIQRVTDPSQQAAAAMQLFGKGGGELLPSLKADVDKLADSTVRMSADAVKALDEFGDALGALKTSATNRLGEIVARLIQVGKEAKSAFDRLQAVVDRAQGLQPGQPSPFANTRAPQAQITGNEAFFEGAILPPVGRDIGLGAALPTPAGLPDLETILKISDALAKSAEFSQKVHEAEADLFSRDTIQRAEQYVAALGGVENLSRVSASSQQKLNDILQTAKDDYKALGLEVPPNVRAAADALNAIVHANAALDQAEKGSTGALIGFSLSLQQLQNIAKGFTSEGLLPTAKGFDQVSMEALAAKKYADQLAASEDALKNELAGVIGLMPDLHAQNKDLIADARAGGLFTEEWASELSELSRGFSHLASVSDGAFGDVVKQIANVVSSLSLATKAAAQFQQAQKAGSLVGQGIAIVSGAASILQATGTGSTGSRTVGGALTGAEVGSFIPGLGTAAGAIIGGGVGLIRGLFGGNPLEKEINPIREAFVQAAGGLSALNEKAREAGVTLAALLDAKNPEQYKKAIDDLTAAFDFQDHTQQVLNDTIAKYGLTIDQLGPTFRQQKLDEQAGQLLQDFKVLEQATGDTGLAAAKTASGFQDLITTSLQTGAEIPNALKDAIQKMIDLGLLTDLSGAKLTDLGQLTFGDQLVNKFDATIDAINKLVDALNRNLGNAFDHVGQQAQDAFNRIPHDIDINFHTRFDDGSGNQYAARGGLVTAHGIQYMGAGGRILPFLKRGTDSVPAMLTPGEMVLTAGQQDELGSALGGTVADFATAKLEAQVAQLERRMATRDADLPKQLARAVRDEVQRIPRRR